MLYFTIIIKRLGKSLKSCTLHSKLNTYLKLRWHIDVNPVAEVPYNSNLNGNIAGMKGIGNKAVIINVFRGMDLSVSCSHF